jgi:crotonobetainyl-CoA:carnitine CoA-transferase CaiB-like acyl-CoA transferase
LRDDDQVTHVDAPGADLTTPLSAVLHRGKSRVTIDLKTKAGLASALALVKAADVVVSNFRPGVMERLGLGAKHCQAVNKEVIYLTLPGYASTDKELADVKVRLTRFVAWHSDAHRAPPPFPFLPPTTGVRSGRWHAMYPFPRVAPSAPQAFEAVLLASAGVFSDMGLNRVLRGVNPSYSPLCLASTYSSVLGATAVTLALYSRDRDGKGDVIEVPLVAGLMDCLVYNSLDIQGLPER